MVTRQPEALSITSTGSATRNVLQKVQHYPNMSNFANSMHEILCDIYTHLHWYSELSTLWTKTLGIHVGKSL
jgi:hypothetical protein